jgi:hypothetical protein
MAANSADKLTKAYQNWSGQLDGTGIADESVDSFGLVSAANLPTDTAVYLSIDRVDANGDETNNKWEVVKGVVSSNNITNVTRGVEGTAQAHSAGAVVEYLMTAAQWNDLWTGLTKEHSQLDGSHTSAVVTTLKASSAEITTGTEDGKVVTPKGLADSGIKTTKIVGIQVVDAATDTAVGDGKAFFRVPAELNGMNLTGVAASVYAAGVTGNLDIMLRNKTDSQDMLSAAMRIETGETDTSTSAQPGTINTSYDDVATGDIIAIDVDAVQTGTAAKGLYVEMRFELP